MCDWEGLAGENMLTYTSLPHQCSGVRLHKCIQGGFNLLSWQHRGRLFECTASVMAKYAMGVDEYMHVYILYMHTKGYTVVFQCEATVRASVHRSYVCVICRKRLMCNEALVFTVR